MFELISQPATWIGFAAGALSMLALAVGFICLIGRANDDLADVGRSGTNSFGPGGVHAANSGTRRADLRTGPR